MSKEFKTIDEQMEILRSRGLLIPDEDQAGEFLLHNNYYRISGYSLTLRQNSISREEVQYPIAARYHLKSNKGRKILGQFMHSMTILRNLCAHGSRLYNRLFEQKPSLNRKELNLLIRKQDGTVDNAHLYGFVMIMRRLLPADDFVTLKSDIMLLVERYPFVHMKYYGFRDDWKNVL